jgi:hypothetical protein
MDPLKPYPFPDGVIVPRLMPFQEYPWNNDHHLAAEVLRLKDAHDITTAFETGTCLGSTTMWLKEHFDTVHSFETNWSTYDIASQRVGPEVHYMDSIDGLKKHKVDGALYFLDAHWEQHCPLLHELYELSSLHRPVIIIHDFKVPGHDFGFDKMPDGRDFDINLIESWLHTIYNGRYKVNYPTEVAGARRGWISVEPT